jgi:hypothetical protein
MSFPEIDQVTPLVTTTPSFFRTHWFLSDPASPSLPDKDKLPPDNSYFASEIVNVTLLDSYILPLYLTTTLNAYFPFFILSFHETIPLSTQIPLI